MENKNEQMELKERFVLFIDKACNIVKEFTQKEKLEIEEIKLNEIINSSEEITASSNKLFGGTGICK